MYKDMQGCTKICNAHNQIIGCRKKHCTKTNACQRILSLQKTYVEVCHKHMELHQTFLCTCSVHKSIVLNVFELFELYCFFATMKSWGDQETGRAPAGRDQGCQWPDHEPWLRVSTPCIFGITINLNLSISVTFIVHHNIVQVPMCVCMNCCHSYVITNMAIDQWLSDIFIIQLTLPGWF